MDLWYLNKILKMTFSLFRISKSDGCKGLNKANIICRCNKFQNSSYEMFYDIDNPFECLIQLYLCIVSTCSFTAWIAVIVIICFFVEPQRNQGFIIQVITSSGCNILPNSLEGTLLGHSVWIVHEYALVSKVLSNSSKAVIPNLI